MSNNREFLHLEVVREVGWAKNSFVGEARNVSDAVDGSQAKARARAPGLGVLDEGARLRGKYRC